jgi:hypothetical protein
MGPASDLNPVSENNRIQFSETSQTINIMYQSEEQGVVFCKQKKATYKYK